MKKKVLFFIFLLIYISTMWDVRVWAEPNVSAQSAILMEAETGTVLYEKDADARMQVASTTKIMTAFVVIDNCDLDEMVTVELEQILVEGSSMYLQAGEEISVRDLLFGLLLCSGNDAASVLAFHAAGSIEAFADMMNAKASELGMSNTSFQNPHGLSVDGHYSTARDMAVLMAAAMKVDVFREISVTKSINVSGHSLTNHNKLLWSYEGLIGGKTGYTKSAGRTLVTCAQRDSTRLVCVTLNAPDDWDDHTALYDYWFENCRYENVLEAGAVLAQVPVISGTGDTVGVVSAEGASLLLDREDELTVAVYAPKFVYAPVIAEADAGKVIVQVNGETVAELPLFYDRDVALDGNAKLDFWERIKWDWYRASE